MAPPRDTTWDDAVVGYLKEGKSVNACAKLVGRSNTAIIAIVRAKRKELGKELGEAFVDKITKASDKNKEIGTSLDGWRQYLLSENRQALLGRTLDKMDGLLKECNDTKSLRDLCVCVGILVDKFGVEQGYTNDSAKGALLKLFKDMEEETKETPLE